MSTTTLLHNELIHRLMADREGPCISLLFPTHRTIPDSDQDELILRRLAKEAEERILELGDKRSMAAILERLGAVAGAIDHRHNEEGMAIFIASDITEVVRLPFPVDERAAVDDTFVTREVIRWKLGGVDHHVLVLGTKGANLYHASNDRLVGEAHGTFPMRNKRSAANSHAASHSTGQTNLLREFNLDVDRAVRKVVGIKGRVVVACTHEQYPHLVAAAEDASIYIGNLHGSYDETAPAAVVKAAWTLAYEDQKKRHLADLEVLRKAPATMHSTSIIDIWRQVREGSGMTLLVERDLRIAAKVNGEHIEFVKDPKAPGVVDDIVDDIIEEQIRMGGEVRILPNGLLAEYKGIALLLRY